jgi:hypothetical protein
MWGERKSASMACSSQALRGHFIDRNLFISIYFDLLFLLGSARRLEYNILGCKPKH